MKLVFLLLGWIFFSLGVVGAFLPILPTTPFLLLSALLFSKSSPRFHRWLLELPVFGEGVKNWQSHKVINIRAKVLCLLMISFSVGFIQINNNISFLLKMAVSLVLVGVLVFVLTRKSSSVKNEKM